MKMFYKLTPWYERHLQNSRIFGNPESFISRNPVGFYGVELCYPKLIHWSRPPPKSSVPFSSVTQSCLTLCDPGSMPGLPVRHQLPEFTQTHAIELLMPSSHLILCRPLLLLPPIPPSIRVFSNESTLRMMWPKYWSFSSISVLPMNTQDLISFRMDWLDLLAVQETLQESSPTP